MVSIQRHQPGILCLSFRVSIVCKSNSATGLFILWLAACTPDWLAWNPRLGFRSFRSRLRSHHSSTIIILNGNKSWIIHWTQVCMSRHQLTYSQVSQAFRRSSSEPMHAIRSPGMTPTSCVIDACSNTRRKRQIGRFYQQKSVGIRTLNAPFQLYIMDTLK